MDADVIIIGAGPSGLFLAGELRTSGIRVIVLEKLLQPTGESRGLGFTARTLETFDQRGLMPRLGDVETTDLGHFGGLPVDFAVLGVPNAGGAKGIPQARTEEMLGEWAAELGADIRRGWEFTGLQDDGGGVTVEADSPAGPRRLRAAYLVGCDGGRSAVRKAAGFAFPGTASTMEMFLGDVRGVEIKTRMIGETVPGGMVMAGPLGDGVTRIIVCERGTPPRRRTQPPAWDEVAGAWQRLTGQDIGGGTALWLSAFGDAARLATEYRRGRVLLVGDAAHIHLPAGGQGMNTSIQDAANLGWKLAATLRGTAPEGLLDSYHEERHEIGKRLLMNTQAQGLLFLSGEEVQPLRDVMSELITHDEVSRHLAGMVSGLSIRYPAGPGDHRLLGLRAPNLELSTAGGTTTVRELLHPARGVLLDLSDDPALRVRAAGWADRVDVVTATVTAAKRPGAEDADLSGADALLIRPDGYVAWVGGPAAPDVADALSRWFGAPAAAAAEPAGAVATA
ncbi:FAD-dependent monooxygenase [Streptomyces sp. B1866]|uniref:FAD-dependent monooxygenase n=1 Tax=Streptomyces sp. B1866 TaxID=3075431 RepID=UPI00288E9326|nr:FAD-dependent monooxygenase [Streptomyces sp. B1866]MDT3395503.1 FAD-dependent monooxygenase [Streptomyces sp. B1866]